MCVVRVCGVCVVSVWCLCVGVVCVLCVVCVGVLLLVLLLSVVVWWIVVFAKLVVSVLSSMRWLLYGVQKRDVTSMTVTPKNDVCNLHKLPRSGFLHYGLN